MTWRRSGEVKREETNLASNHFPKCFPVQNTQRDSQSEVEKRRGREEIEVSWGRKGRGQ